MVLAWLWMCTVVVWANHNGQDKDVQMIVESEGGLGIKITRMRRQIAWCQGMWAFLTPKMIPLQATPTPGEPHMDWARDLAPFPSSSYLSTTHLSLINYYKPHLYSWAIDLRLGSAGIKWCIVHVAHPERTLLSYRARHILFRPFLN